jgi:hypothetical protein
MKKVFKLLMIFLAIVGILSLFYVQKEDSLKESIKECDNYNEIQQFNKPIPVVWTAKFDGCLASCWGAAFTKVPEDFQYSRFSGYVPDEGEKISDEYMKEGQILKIYGKWTDVSASYASVFNNKCVPTVEIEKIEILEQ